MLVVQVRSSVMFLFQIEKLHAVGWRPLLLLEYPYKKAKMILPKDLALGTNAQTCVNNIHEIYKIMVEGETIFSIYI